jgi:hypothetical protein
MLISGNIAYDLNRLTECRNAWDITMRIRLNKLAHDDPAGKLSLAALVSQNTPNLNSSCFDLQQHG